MTDMRSPPPARPLRRHLLRHGAAALGGALGARLAVASTPAPAAAGAAAFTPAAAPTPVAVAHAPARLALLNTHTGERLDVVYRERGAYVDDALAAIDQLLRDHRTGDVAPIDRRLLDLVHRLGELTDARQPFHVISGYRSPATNARLAGASSGVARRSLHLDGRAIDLRLPGRDLLQLHRAALSLQAGGVGLYRGSDFVHVDTGRVRAW